MQTISHVGVHAGIRRINYVLEASFASGNAAGIAGVSTDEAGIFPRAWRPCAIARPVRRREQ